VPRRGARNLYEAIQSYLLLWQTMNLEQSPNPFAFSVGNLDRILQPFFQNAAAGRRIRGATRAARSGIFCVGRPQLGHLAEHHAGGMDEQGRDLTCDMTHALIRAFELFNYAQPNLSLKLHRARPPRCLKTYPGSCSSSVTARRRFSTTGGVPRVGQQGRVGCGSATLRGSGLPGAARHGPRVRNTTNSWLNLAKILELALNDGASR